MLKEAWAESGKVSGYRKLHDDLVEQGESICPNRVARLTRLAGIKAQIGYKRRPGRYGGRPSIAVDNTLERQFNVGAPDRVWVIDITYVRTQEGFAYLAVVIDLFSRRVVGWSMQSRQTDRRRLASAPHGHLAEKAEGQGADPFGPRQPVHQHGLGRVPPRPQPGALNEPPRELP